MKLLLLNPNGQMPWPNFNPHCTSTLRSINLLIHPLLLKKVPVLASKRLSATGLSSMIIISSSPLLAAPLHT